MWAQAYINDVTLYGPSAVTSFDMPGSMNYKMAAWMMRDDVRKALHVDGAPATAWPGPVPHVLFFEMPVLSRWMTTPC